MTAHCVRRIVNGYEEWLSKDRHGWWQWSNDWPSRTRFSSEAEADATVLSLYRQVMGEPQVVPADAEPLVRDARGRG